MAMNETADPTNPGSWRRTSLLKWIGMMPGQLPIPNGDGKVYLDDGRHLEYEVGLRCIPSGRCCPPTDSDGTRWLDPSYSPFTDPYRALDHARWQADHVYGSEHTPLLRVRAVTDYEEIA